MSQPMTSQDALALASPARAQIDRLGDKWVLLVVAVVGIAPIRFGNLRRRVEGISQKMLSQTLRALERDGLVERRVLSARPLAVEYRLSTLGLTLAPLATAVKVWAESHAMEIVVANAAYDARQAVIT